jgi:L-ribulose-5-phosphate 3-epimerase
MTKNHKIGILQGRLTPSNGRGIQFFPQEEWQEEFQLAHNIGFDCIELLVKANDHKNNPLFNKEDLDKIKSLKKQSEIETLSIHGFYNKEKWYPAVLIEMISIAKLVGANTILVSFFNENSLLNDTDKQKVQEQLKKPLKIAEELGISIAVETEILARELKLFVESFHSNAIGIYYDLGNMASMNVLIAEEIKLLKHLIKGVHIKDRKKNGGESVVLGDGDTDFKEAFDALESIGYNGPYVIQGARHSSENDVVLNKKYLNFVKDKLTLNIKNYA